MIQSLLPRRFKILLDENLPHEMRLEIPGHDVFTAAYLGWAGVKNGRLLLLAAENGFDAVITNDREVEYQQNLNSLPVAVVVIIVKSSAIEDIRPIYAKLFKTLASLQPCELVHVQ